MSTRSPRPPRLAARVLAWLLPGGAAGDAVVGDLEEAFHADCRTASIGRARWRWYRRATAIALRLAVYERFERPRRQPKGATAMTGLTDDLRGALRSLRRAPSFAALAVLTLAAGIGATTAVFSVVDGVLLRPLPYADPASLVVPRYQTDGPAIRNHSEPEFFDYRAEVASFAQVAAYTYDRPIFGDGQSAERMLVIESSWELLELLGVDPLLGRVHVAADDVPGADEAVVVLSHGLWTTAFAGDVQIVGRSVLLEGRPHTVIGVMPEGFVFPSAEVRAWVPLALDPADPWGRNNHYLSIVARLADGVATPAAQAELDALASRHVDSYPEFYPSTLRFPLTPLADELVGDVKTPLAVIFAAVLGVLLVAAVNTAALFTARGEERRDEIAVRTAIGGSRSRVARQLVIESLLVAGIAATLGTLFAGFGVEAVRLLAPPDLPRLDQVGVDLRVLFFGGVVAVVTGLVFGLSPVAQALRSDVRSVMAGGGRGGVGRRHAARSRRSMVVVQLAFATTLLLSAGLLVRSFEALRGVDLGFEPASLTAFSIQPAESMVAEGEDAARFYDDLERGVRSLPGVVSAGAALRLALADGEDNYSIQVEGRLVETSAQAPVAGMQYATAGYREAMGIRLERGRWFSDVDGPDQPLVAVVNQSLADELWPGDDPLGRRLRMFPDGNPWMEVVGVVDDVSYLGVRTPPPSKLYIPHRQAAQSAYYAPNAMTMVVRTVGGPGDLAAQVRGVVASLRPGVPVGPVRGMDSVVASALGPDRFVLLLLAVFAGVALLLAAVSIYGVVARSVSARTREIGVRMALGADRSKVAREVVVDGLAMAAIGCVLGLFGGWIASRAVASLLFETSPLDPVAWLSVVPILGVTAILACVVPARRAADLNPVEALRSG